MITCLGRSCLFGLLCMSFWNVYEFVCVLLSRLVFKGGMWVVIVLISDTCLSIYSRLALSRLRLSRITAYLEEKLLSLF